MRVPLASAQYRANELALLCSGMSKDTEPEAYPIALLINEYFAVVGCVVSPLTCSVDCSAFVAVSVAVSVADASALVCESVALTAVQSAPSKSDVHKSSVKILFI